MIEIARGENRKPLEMKGVYEYEEIDEEWLVTLAREGYVVADPILLDMNNTAVAIREEVWIVHSTVLLIVWGNLKHIIGRDHCWALLNSDSRHWRMVDHYINWMYCWKIDKIMEYWDNGGYLAEVKNKKTILLGEQMDKWFVCKEYNWWCNEYRMSLWKTYKKKHYPARLKQDWTWKVGGKYDIKNLEDGIHTFWTSTVTIG